MTWLILVDQERDFSNADTPHKVMTTRDYLSRPQLFREGKPKIINLARSYGYQGAGYYCSLLAEARLNVGRTDAAIEALETAAELNPRHYYALGDLYETELDVRSAATVPGTGPTEHENARDASSAATPKRTSPHEHHALRPRLHRHRLARRRAGLRRARSR